MECDHKLRDQIYAEADCPACLKLQVIALKKEAEYVRERELKRISDAACKVGVLNLRIIRLEAFVRQVILDRGCVCNEVDHRCATNQMLEDLEAILEGRSTTPTLLAKIDNLTLQLDAIREAFKCDPQASDEMRDAVLGKGKWCKSFVVIEDYIGGNSHCGKPLPCDSHNPSKGSKG